MNKTIGSRTRGIHAATARGAPPPQSLPLGVTGAEASVVSERKTRRSGLGERGRVMTVTHHRITTTTTSRACSSACTTTTMLTIPPLLVVTPKALLMAIMAIAETKTEIETGTEAEAMTANASIWSEVETAIMIEVEIGRVVEMEMNLGYRSAGMLTEELILRATSTRVVSGRSRGMAIVIAGGRRTEAAEIASVNLGPG